MKRDFAIEFFEADRFEPVCYWVLWELNEECKYVPLDRYPTKAAALEAIEDLEHGI